MKLNPGATRKIDTLLINGTECEPYITADDTLMQCHAEELIEGAQILAHVVSADAILIGIEDTKLMPSHASPQRSTDQEQRLSWRPSPPSIPRVEKSKSSKY